MSAQRTPAQWFCLLGGGILLARGLVGYAFLDSSFDLPGEGWHHLIHLVSGIALLAAGREPAGARFLAIAFGALYTGVALIGIVDGADVLGVIEADVADKTFHTVLGLTALGAGLASRAGGRAAPRPSST